MEACYFTSLIKVPPVVIFSLRPEQVAVRAITHIHRHTQIQIYTHEHALTHTLHLYKHLHANTQIYTHLYSGRYKSTHTHAPNLCKRMRTNTHSQKRTYTSTRRYTSLHTNAHTHTHTHIDTPTRTQLVKRFVTTDG